MKPYCLFFRPLATNRDICARYIRPDSGPRAITQFVPFCAADIDPCPTEGLRSMAEAELKDYIGGESIGVIDSDFEVYYPEEEVL